MNVSFAPTGWEHFVYWLETDKAVARKINALIKDCLRHPFEGIGKPEALKGNHSGCWSRRIDREHRLVYRVDGDSLIIIQCRYHY